MAVLTDPPVLDSTGQKILAELKNLNSKTLDLAGMQELTAEAKGYVDQIKGDADSAASSATSAQTAAANASKAVTPVSITESTEDGGSNTVTFGDGTVLTVKNGSKGDTGAAYVLTDTDKASIVSAVVEEVHATSGTGMSKTCRDDLIKLLRATVYDSSILADPKSVVDEIESEFNAVKIPATGITVSPTTLSFTSSTPQTITATLTPTDTTDKVVWSTSSASIATVTDGTVTPVADGSATITATAGSVSADCVVTVKLPVTFTVASTIGAGLTISNSATKVDEGSSYVATITPDSSHAIDTVTVTMGGKDITSAAYSSGTISIGTVTGDIVITATAKNDIKIVDGYLGLFDFRNYDDEHFTYDSGKVLTTFLATSGVGKFIDWHDKKTNAVSNDYGLANVHFLSYINDNTTTEYTFPSGNWTYCVLGYKGRPFRNSYSQLSNTGNDAVIGTYVSTDGTQKKITNTGTTYGSKAGYVFNALTCDGTNLKIYDAGQLIYTFKGTDYSDFKNWYLYPELCCQYVDTITFNACIVVYEKTLSDAEITQCYLAMKEYEVKA